MSDLWWKNGLVYALDVKTFLDSDGDGIGDLNGAAAGIDYLAGIGVTCLWLLPVCASPWRDDGYDVADYLTVDPRLGDLGDFVSLTRAARQNGIRIILDLPLNHTSDRHPWFRRARSSRESPYRNYYVWADEPPPDAPSPVFPGEQESTYTYDEAAGQYYLHRYHDFMPDLNTDEPAVRQEMFKILGFWLALGVDGFRMDSVPFLIEEIADGEEDASHDYLRDLRSFIARRSSDAVLIGEANLPARELARYFGEAGAEEMRMMYDFLTSGAMWIAMAQERAEPIERQLAERRVPPEVCSYLTFLRHHDELSFEHHFGEDEKKAAFAAFAPREDQRAYGRGIRRRLSPMLGDDPERVRLALSLLLSMPGTPVVLYGDEFGLGDDPDLPGRLSSRVLMQWNGQDNGGFSPAPAENLVRPPIPDGPYGYRRRSVAAQLRDPMSRLNWFRRAVATRKECPEIGAGRWHVAGSGDEAVLAVRYDYFHQLLVLHNLSGRERTAHIGEELSGGYDEILADRDYPRVETSGDPAEPSAIPLGPYGFRWLRLHRPSTGTTR